MSKRKYKTKWHRYGTVIGVLLVAIGGLFMILLGIQALFDESIPKTILISTYITLSSEFTFLWSLVTISCGIVILLVTVQQKPHSQDTLAWMIVSALLGILGGTLGGLITFGGAIIYLLVYVL